MLSMLRLALIVVVTLAMPPLVGGQGLAWHPVGLSGGGAMFNPAISPADPQLAIVHCDMSAAYLTRDGGASWQMIHTAQLRSNTRCRAAFHSTDARVIYSPHGGSTLKVSRDAGTHWEELAKFDDALIGPITLDSREPARLLVGVGKTLRLSTDGGKTWQTARNVAGVFVGAHVVHDGTAVRIFAATDRGIWRSDDGGATWADFCAGLPSKEIRGLSGGTRDGKTVLYGTIPGQEVGGKCVGGIYRWKTGQQGWESATGTGLNLDTKAFDRWGMGAVAQYHQVATTDEKPEVVWVTSASTGVPPPHHATVYRSDDGGTTWRATFFPDPRFKGFNVEKGYTVVEDGQFYQDHPQIAVDWHNPDRVLQINGGDCYFTLDGGKTWKCGHARAVGDARPGCAWTCTGLVVTTTWNYYIDPHESKRHYIGYTDIGFARSLDAGQTWIWWASKASSPWRNTCYELAFDPSQPGRIWGAFSNVHDIPNSNIIFNRHRGTGPGGICVSDDFAATWKPPAGGLPKAPATAIVVDPKSPKEARILYAGFFGDGVYKSINGGKTWAAKNTGLGDPTNLRVCRVQLHPDGTLFALVTATVKGRQFQQAGVGLYRSTDRGDSWTCITGSAPCLWPKDFTLDPGDSRTIYLGLCDANGKQSGGLYRTTDGGTSWALMFRAGREHFGAYLHPRHPGWIYATLTEDAPMYGLYLSKDNGKTFRPIEGMPFDNAMRVAFDPANGKVIYATTFGGSVWRGPAE